MWTHRALPGRISLLVAMLPLACVAACSDDAPRTAGPTLSATASASPATTAAVPSRSASATPSVPSPGSALVSWIGDVCTASSALDGVLSGASFPQVPDNPTEADRSTAIAFLTKARDAFERSSSILAGLAPAPVDGGDEMVAATRRDIEDLRRSLDTYLSNVKRFPASEIDAPFRIALIELVSTSPFDPLHDLRDRDPLVAAAYEEAPECA